MNKTNFFKNLSNIANSTIIKMMLYNKYYYKIAFNIFKEYNYFNFKELLF